MPVRPDEAVIAIAGPADVRTIEAAHRKVLAALQGNCSIRMDLEVDAQVDLTLVQLVEAARRFAAAEGKSLTLSSPATGALYEILLRGGFVAGAPDRAFWLHEKEGC